MKLNALEVSPLFPATVLETDRLPCPRLPETVKNRIRIQNRTIHKRMLALLILVPAIKFQVQVLPVHCVLHRRGQACTSLRARRTLAWSGLKSGVKGLTH